VIYVVVIFGTVALLLFWSTWYFARLYGEELTDSIKSHTLIALTMNDLGFYVHSFGTGSNAEVDVFQNGKIVASIKGEDRDHIQLETDKLNDEESKALQQYGSLIINAWDFVTNSQDLDEHFILRNQAYYNEDEFRKAHKELEDTLDEYKQQLEAIQTLQEMNKQQEEDSND
jgi:hypothetical protein